MKKLLIPPGGMPLEGDDLLYMQNGYVEALMAICKSLGGTDKTIVLTGLKTSVVGNDIVITEGYLYIDGEICYFAGGTADGAAATPYSKSLDFEVVYEPAGNEVFADAQSKDTYYNKRVIIVDGATGSPQALPVDFIADRRVELFFEHSNIPMGPNTQGAVKVYKHGQRVHVIGTIDAGTVVGVKLFTIPSGFRPDSPRGFINSFDELNSNSANAPTDPIEKFLFGLVRLKVQSNGEVFGIHMATNDVDSIAMGKLNINFSYLI